MTVLATWAGGDFATVSATPIDGREPGHELPPGTRVERYQILGLVGRGGMGEVYAAYHPDLDRRIALKIVYGARAAEPERQRQLLREARIIARLSHPNIVAVHDAGMVGDHVYVAMEFVDGQTLDAWVREKNRRCQEIVDVFVAAGRGLVAAHAANVVHRDFKPQNVMIGRDGRVRVMDFGVARPLRERVDPSAAAWRQPDGDALGPTTAGALVGTPAYMAPEQLRGGDVDVRADQFSFCVALYEALYRVRPGITPIGARGRRRAVGIPAWLKSVLRKGLEIDRDKRFDSMQDLLRSLDRRRNPLRALAVTLAVAVLLALGMAIGARPAKTRQFSCTAPRARIEAVWPAVEAPGSRRSTLHRLFAGSGLSGGEATWQRVAAKLDDRVRRWADMYRDACEATHVRGEQSAGVLDLRMTCLMDDLDTTRAYLDGLLVSDPARLRRALAIAAGLPSIERCANLKDLRSQMPLPTDARAREQVGRLQQAINDAEALRSIRYPERAEQQLSALVPEIRRLGYKPLLAQALQNLAAAQADMELFEASRLNAQEALDVAEASHDDMTVARVADALVWSALTTARFDEAKQWLDFGDAVVERAGAQGTLVQGWLRNDRGNLFYSQGRFDEAERDHRAAISIKIGVLGPRHPDVSGSMINLSLDLQELGRWDEAQQMAERAIAIDEQSGNQRSASYAIDLLGLGEILVHARHFDEADATLSKALALEQQLGDADLVRTVTMTDLGHLALLRGRASRAVALLREARGLQARIGERDPIRLALTSSELGRAMVELGRDRGAGVELAADACATLARGGYVRVQREVLDWSQQLPTPDRLRIARRCAGGAAQRAN